MVQDTSATQDAYEAPQLYLITPASFDLATFTQSLAAVVDTVEVACLRLRMATRDEDEIARAADALREVAHARDLALVVEEHVGLVERLGLDGVHLLDGSRSVRAVRKELGEEAIIGTFCGASRHDGMSAGEAEADYVSFGPIGQTSLGSGERPERGLFEWWSEVIEVPIVAEGALDAALIEDLAPVTDFFGIGDEIWTRDDPAAALKALTAVL